MAPRLRQRIVERVRRFIPTDSSRDIANDVAQDTLLRLWIMRDRLDEYRSVEALAMVVARNIAIDYLRSAQPMNTLDGLDFADGSSLPDDLLVASETQNCFDSILASLPSVQQAVLRMRHQEGMEIEEIAQAIGSNPGAIRTALSRARQNVRTLFAKRLRK